MQLLQLKQDWWVWSDCLTTFIQKAVPTTSNDTCHVIREAACHRDHHPICLDKKGTVKTVNCVIFIFKLFTDFFLLFHYINLDLVVETQKKTRIKFFAIIDTIDGPDCKLYKGPAPTLLCFGRLVISNLRSFLYSVNPNWNNIGTKCNYLCLKVKELPCPISFEEKFNMNTPVLPIEKLLKKSLWCSDWDFSRFDLVVNLDITPQSCQLWQ